MPPSVLASCASLTLRSAHCAPPGAPLCAAGPHTGGCRMSTGTFCACREHRALGKRCFLRLLTREKHLIRYVHQMPSPYFWGPNKHSWNRLELSPRVLFGVQAHFEWSVSHDQAFS